MLLNKTPKAPFNFTSVVEGLKYIAGILFSIFSGGKPLGMDTFDFDENSDYDLVTNVTPPSESFTYALIIIEADSTATDQNVCARFTRTSGATPTASVGMPLGHLGQVEVSAFEFDKFKIIGVEAGKTHTLRIEFFG